MLVSSELVVTAQFGLSLALGAFIAGLVLSESEYSHQIVADVLPFRDVFNSIFFISIGMLLSIGFLVTNVWMVMAWVLALIVGKAIIVALAVRLLGNSLRVSTMTAVGLAGRGILVHPRQGRTGRDCSRRRLSNFLAPRSSRWSQRPF